jgi:hypothetical protein
MHNPQQQHMNSSSRVRKFISRNRRFCLPLWEMSTTVGHNSVPCRWTYLKLAWGEYSNPNCGNSTTRLFGMSFVTEFDVSACRKGI